ncbi:MAG: HIT family protein [Candidatus Paceibacterota bacterium]|jgi:histidine triad (HIT) family protein
MSSTFTQILRKEIPGQEVFYEDDKVFIFLARNPHTEGHSLIVPIKEVSRFEELDHDIFSHMAVIAQKYAKVLEDIYSPERVGVAIDGFQIDHVHMHIMPIWREKGGVWKSDTNPELTQTASDEELKRVTDILRSVMPKYFN